MMLRTFVLSLALAAGLGAATVVSGQETPAAAGDAAAGKTAYEAECAACHGAAIGPPMAGVAGRKIASVASYGGYSDSLRELHDEAWTDQNLDEFLKAPLEFAPGSRMSKAVPDDKTRANIIAYLHTLTPPQ